MGDKRNKSGVVFMTQADNFTVGGTKTHYIQLVFHFGEVANAETRQ